ncbi:MAG TPA: DUF6754 domain-containing protein [Herpetosiphonaceae bacterium]
MTVLDWLIVTLILAFAMLPLLYARTAGRQVRRRPLPATDTINAALARAAETGQPVHVSPGAGSLHGGQPSEIAAESFAGLMLAQRITESATRRGTPVAASSGDAVSHLALRGMIHATYRDAGYGDDYQSRQIQLLADQDPAAFAAGLANRYHDQPVEVSVAVGSFGDRYLLAGEQGRQLGVRQVAGTTNVASLAAAVLTTNDVLYGEEIYAAEAYVNPSAQGTARLLTHDALRVLVVVLLVAIVLLAVARELGVLPPALSQLI